MSIAAAIRSYAAPEPVTREELGFDGEVWYHFGFHGDFSAPTADEALRRMNAARQAGVAIQEYTPLQVKQAVVGYGRAEKQQVISMVTALLGLKEAPKPDDTADALAIAICHAHCGGSRLASYFNRNTV